MFRSFLRRLKMRTSPARKTRSVRLTVESLENRVLPALPFTGVPAPFTQELVATAPDGAAISGYAFDAQNNPYFQDLNSLHIYEVDLSQTIMSHGSAIHPLIDKGVTTF